MRSWPCYERTPLFLQFCNQLERKDREVNWPRFTNGFSIAFQIRWKFRFTLISSLIKWSLQNVEHGTTAVLSWHVQKFVVIWWPATELQHDEVSIEFQMNCGQKTVSETGPLAAIFWWIGDGNYILHIWRLSGLSDLSVPGRVDMVYKTIGNKLIPCDEIIQIILTNEFTCTYMSALLV